MSTMFLVLQAGQLSRQSVVSARILIERLLPQSSLETPTHYTLSTLSTFFLDWPQHSGSNTQSSRQSIRGYAATSPSHFCLNCFCAPPSVLFRLTFCRVIHCTHGQSTTHHYWPLLSVPLYNHLKASLNGGYDVVVVNFDFIVVFSTIEYSLDLRRLHIDATGVPSSGFLFLINVACCHS